MRRVLSVLLTLVLIPAAAVVSSVVVVTWLRGPDVSDVGVPMYPNASGAYFAGLCTFIVIGVSLLFAARRWFYPPGRVLSAAGWTMFGLTCITWLWLLRFLSG